MSIAYWTACLHKREPIAHNAQWNAQDGLEHPSAEVGYLSCTRRRIQCVCVISIDLSLIHPRWPVPAFHSQPRWRQSLRRGPELRRMLLGSWLRG